MRGLLILGCICATYAAAAQVVLEDRAHGVSLTYDRKRDAAGIVETQRWTEARSTRTIVCRFDSKGMLLERTFTSARGSSTTHTVAKIGDSGASVTTGSRTTDIRLVKRLSTVDLLQAWSFSSPPAKETTGSFMSFDPERRYWEEVTVSYQGKASAGHLVTRRSARSVVKLVLDDSGMPLIWEEGRLRLVRRRQSKLLLFVSQVHISHSCFEGYIEY